MSKAPDEVPHVSPATKRFLTIDAIEAQLGFLQGEILTLAEASLPDPSQCKAFKDLAKQFFRSRMRWIAEVSQSPDSAAGPNSYGNSNS